MTTGTKVFLACFALLVVGLAVYYGEIVPSKRSPNAIRTVGPETTTPQGIAGGVPDAVPATSAGQSRLASAVDEIAAAAPEATGWGDIEAEKTELRRTGQLPAIAPSASSDARSEPRIESNTEPAIATMAVSNTDTLDRTAGSADRNPLVYTIGEGDTLSSIARDWLGDAGAWPRIRDANPGLKPNRLRVGDEIILPGLKGLATQPEAGALYVVQEGETLIDIARAAYGRDRMWKRIFDMNRATIGNPDRLEVGMRLRLPARPSEA